MIGELRGRLDTGRFRIVDSHAHLGFYAPFDIQGDCADDLIKQMDQVGVDCAALSPLAGLGVDVPLGNDSTAAMLKKYPNRLIGMAVVNPNRPETILPELERCFSALGMGMIKLHPSFTKCPMSSKNYDAVYGFANERGLAILNHDWESPERMERLANRYPNMRLIQAHSAGNWDGHREDDYFRVARDCENAYVDVCASPIFYDALEKLVDIVGEDHIVFGSDMPFLSLGYAVGKVMMANLTDEVKQKILADNFMRALKNSGEE